MQLKFDFFGAIHSMPMMLETKNIFSINNISNNNVYLTSSVPIRLDEI